MHHIEHGKNLSNIHVVLIQALAFMHIYVKCIWFMYKSNIFLAKRLKSVQENEHIIFFTFLQEPVFVYICLFSAAVLCFYCLPASAVPLYNSFSHQPSCLSCLFYVQLYRAKFLATVANI